MNILSLDLSTKSTGWAISTDSNLIAHGTITAGSSNVFNRIDKMKEEVEKIVVQYQVKDCAIEDVIPEDVRFNNNVFKPLMYLQGDICNMLDKHSVKWTFYVASEWRKKCGIKTGRGIKRDSLKPQDKMFVKKVYGIDVNDDEADAICINYAHTHEPIPVSEPEIIVTEDGFEFE